MVKLTAKNDWQRCAWYFHNMKQCEKFQKVFRDHGAYINWNNPIEAPSFPEMDTNDYIEMDRKPKKRAEDDLPWAFNSYCKANKECDRSMEIARSIMERMENSNE